MNEQQPVLKKNPEDGKTEGREDLDNAPLTVHEEFQTLTPPPAIPAMEVHHHPDLHHKKKHWKEYFLEFLMIFIAVVLGFLSENVRETYVEHERELQFVRSLANDVTADIARLTYIIAARTKKEIRMDSLTFLLNDPAYAKYGNDIYYYAIIVTRGIGTRFIPNDGTMQQLKNAGGLRLIHKQAAADSIIKYDVQVRDLIRTDEEESKFIDEYRKISPRMFNGLAFDKMTDSANFVSRPADNPALFSYDKASLNELNYCIYSVKAINKAARRDGRSLLQRAVHLLDTLKKEYPL
jgi:hypothetical protein